MQSAVLVDAVLPYSPGMNGRDVAALAVRSMKLISRRSRSKMKANGRMLFICSSLGYHTTI